MKRDKYEISLWEDYIVDSYEDEDGKVPEHYEERKICVIGSNEMTAQWRAREPKLVQNINGSNTFTFKMFYTYIDTETGVKTTNPFLKQLVNERKVKVFWKNKWYDLIIKSCQEDSNGKSITYTCKDLFINELSKNGFDLEFSSELMNNQGTAEELGSRILEETDWQLGPSDIIRQKVEEPVYEIFGLESFQTDNGLRLVDSTKKEIIIPQDGRFLVFYSCVSNKSNPFQILYSEQEFTTDDNAMLVTNGENYFLPEGVKTSWTEVDGDKPQITINDNDQITKITFYSISNDYRAERLNYQQIQIFDPVVDQYVSVYQKDGQEIYGYESSHFTAPTTVVNLVTNPSNFGNFSGWSNNQELPMDMGLFPRLAANTEMALGDSYLFLKAGQHLNSGIKDNASYLDNGIQPGQKYIFRYKAALNSADGPLVEDNEVKLDETKLITPYIGKYKEVEGGYDTTDQSFIDIFDNKFVEDGWYEFEIIVKPGSDYSLSKSELLKTKFGLILEVAADCWIKEVQLFKFAEGEVTKYDDNGEVITTTGRMNPNEITTQSVAQKHFNYYIPNPSASSIDDVVFLYQGTEEKFIDLGLVPQYPKDENGNLTFEKIRSIEEKNSNRFNLLQKVAETFECYTKFTIEHEENGKIKYVRGIPQKFVSFHEEIGQRTGIGFVYGIDLKTISRTITSDQIVTKTIVLQNNNEYATNGFCTIARAKDNLSKANFILNFDYYISHGLLSSGQINGDLYDTSEMGYYPRLRVLNEQYDDATEILKVKENELLHYNSYYETYTKYISAIKEEQIKLLSDMTYLAAKKPEQVNEIADIEAYLVENKEDTKVKNLLLAYKNNENLLSSYERQTLELNEILEASKILVKQLKENQESIVEQLEALDKEFYHKYSRFIQEGSWNSEEYIDDNLYYLDALSVSYTSARPRVQYNISVLRLSALEEFKNKVFNLGDIGYIQDTEFFGYITSDSYKTPYKEEILISEITSNFDNPENDSFKVQNYKTQFEDLFQRITATTQSLQYAQGGYQRAASAIQSDGTIDPTVLQNSLVSNENILITSQNNSIIQDSTGITLTDLSNPNNKLKLTSQGIIATNDGGATWRTGMSAAGIDTTYLKSGSISTGNIVITSGEYPTFRWGEDGINAYQFIEGEGVHFNTFVRLDQYGLYGVKDKGSTLSPWIPSGEEEIWDEAAFGMTWNGFFVKNREGSGWVEVSSDNDVAVFKNGQEIPKIKIGRLSGSGDSTVYGIRIADDNGVPVLETDDSGKLWLKDKLQVETYNSNNSVQIGKLDNDETKNEIHGGRVIDANNQFMVYEDGHMKATSGEFTGIINATGGQIGGLSVEAISSQFMKAEIESTGQIFIDNSPSTITLTANLVGSSITPEAYRWFKDSTEISNSNTQILEVNFNDIKENSFSTYKCEILIKESGQEKTYTAYKTIQRNMPSGSTIYSLETNQQEILKFYSQDGTYGISPEDFTIKAFKNGEQLSKDNIYYKIYINNLLLQIEDNSVKLGNELIDNIYPYYHWNEYIPYNNDNDESESSSYYIIEGTKYIESTETTTTLDRYSLVENTNNIFVIDLYNILSQLNDKLDNILTLDYSTLEIQLYENNDNNPKARYFYGITRGLTQEFATFSIHAKGITAAIENTGLEFNKNGLQIVNGGFEIVKEVENYIIDEEGNQIKSIERTSLLKYNPSTKQLEIVGNGKFTGNIIAQGGEIGGFSIKDGFLQSSDSNKSITLDGINGKITAENIELGTGAEIADFIKLGNAYIYNPDVNERKFIESNCVDEETQEVYSILITDEATAKIGKIDLNGVTSTISGTNFSITPDLSVFNNVEITGKLRTSVFEAGTIQSVGGSMLFEHAARVKESSSVLEKEYKIITGTDGANFNIGDYVYLTGNNYKYKTFITDKTETTNGGYTFLVESFGNNYTKDTVIEVMTFLANFGKSAAEANNLIIGVNSSQNKEDFLLGRGFSFLEAVVDYIYQKEESPSKEKLNTYYEQIVEYIQSTDKKIDSSKTYYELLEESYVPVSNPSLENINNYYEQNIIYLKTSDEEIDSLKEYYNLKIENPKILSQPNLFIGDLKSVELEDQSKLSGYGLYGDNVYLNGTLTTKVGEKSYAGINTISGAAATIFKDYSDQNINDNSRIVFWGGATGRSDEEIQAANFQVTENGSIYASSGVFTGTIISNSTIEGSILRAAKIYGSSSTTEEDETPALQIYNTNENYGIEFREEKDSNDYKTLSLSTKGFIAYSRDNTTDTKFIGFNIDNEDDSIISVDAKFNEISFNNLTNGEITVTGSTIKHFDGQSIKFKEDKVSFNINDSPILEYSSGQTTSKKNFQAELNIIYGTEAGKMEYQQQIFGDKIVGYDLYIS